MSEILCIIDGMTDPDFAVCRYPNLSRMNLIRYQDTAQGQEPESLGCILRLLGVKKVPTFLRGYVEALGSGIPVNANDLVLRGSWFALDSQGRCTVPIAGPDALPGIDCCRYYPMGQYKSLLIFPGMASFVSDLITCPPYVCTGRPAQELCPRGCRTVETVFQTLLTPERCLIPWGQSVSRTMAPFPQKGAVVCGTTIVKGIARMLDMDLIPVPGATGDVDTDLSGKVQAALHAAREYPFVLLHINGADEAAHRKSRAEKEAFLEKIDQVVIPALMRSGHQVYVTADHGTDPVSGTHVAGLQPVFFSKSEMPPEKVESNSQDSIDRTEEPRIWAIRQLRKKATEVGRLPTKADFEPKDKIRIKAALGPWPRALEAAGLKEPKEKKTANRR